jgi:hypothetical protein
MQANSHDDARSSCSRPYQNVSRETFLSDRRRKSYKPQDKRFVFDLVGPADFFGAIELWSARSLDGRVQRLMPSNV